LETSTFLIFAEVNKPENVKEGALHKRVPHLSLPSCRHSISFHLLPLVWFKGSEALMRRDTLWQCRSLVFLAQAAVTESVLQSQRERHCTQWPWWKTAWLCLP